MTVLNEKQRKAANRALIFSILFALISILLSGGITMSLPPSTYIFLGVFILLFIPTVVLGLIALKAPPTRKKAIASLIITILFSMIFFFSAASGLRGIPARQSLVNIENTVLSACAGQAIQGTASYQLGPGPHRIVAVNESEYSPVSTSYINNDYWPAILSELDLVLCLGDEYSEKIESCDYSDGTVKSRYQFKRDLLLVAPLTGETISSVTLAGSMPKECPSGINQGNSDDIKGSKPTFFDINSWLEDTLSPGN